MVCVISLLVIVTALYSFSYVKEYKGKGAGSMGFYEFIYRFHGCVSYQR